MLDCKIDEECKVDKIDDVLLNYGGHGWGRQGLGGLGLGLDLGLDNKITFNNIKLYDCVFPILTWIV